MAINLKFDLIGNPEPPSIVLANRNGNKLGQLNVNADSIDVSDKFNAASEFSFTLNKYIDDKPTPLWDKVVDFKLVYCPEWDLWFEIKVELDETTETVKTVFCTQLGQAELSQIKVYNIHINEEGDPNWDSNNETYKSTILYDPQNTDTSLLHRLLKDKAPHYSIAYVDESIQRIQKTFSFDDISICDAFNEIAEEIGCLFVYDSNTQAGGKPSRTISVYDLQQKCNDCGHRGEFTDKCPKCGSVNIKYGYGEDTTIFVTSDELATEGIQLVTDIDSVKNCFKLEGGDDLMTATIRNCNPNGSDYIWYFSDSLKEDMSDELVEAIEGYDDKYKEYYDLHISNLDTSLVGKYNALVEKYKEYYNTPSTCINCDYEGEFENECPSCHSENILTGKSLQTIDTEITGYSNLMTAYYNTIDLLLYLESGLMPTPDIETNKTSAEEQIALLTSSSLSPVAVNVKEAEDISETTSKSAVLSMAKVLIKSTYKVEAETLAFNNVIDADGVIVAKTWEGKFTVTNYSDDTDTATSDSVRVTVNVDAKTFIEQKIKKALNKENTDDYSIIGLFAKEYDEFCEEIKKYALNPLDNFGKACDTCLSILAEQGVGDDGSNEDNETDEATKKALYDALYKPYFDKQQAINTEIKIRQDEIAIIEGVWDKADENNPQCTTWGLQQYIEECQQDIQEELDFEKHLGEDLWLEFCAYRREDKYSNSNYVSDGLNNAELFERANEFIAVAEEEIFKSAELQHSISATLNNLLSLPKFKPLLKSFKTGNWIRVQVDNRVYKLRLLEYGFGYGDSESISVEFSDVTKIKNGVTDVKEVLEQASSMASSYDSVQRQAEKGNVARSTIDQWLVDGLDSADVQIKSNDSEEIILTKSGLLARSYDDITGTYLPEQFKLTHNIMAYTDDNWKTVSSALGKHDYKKWNGSSFVDDEGYGLTSKFVTAGYITGSQIIGGEIVSSNYQIGESGTYLNLIKGDFDFAGGKIVYNADKNRVTLSGVEIQWDSVNTPTIENIDGLSSITEDIRIIEQGLSATTINGQYVISPNIIGGYLDIKNINNNTGVVIDPNGLVNNDYIFRVYNGSTTTIGADINGNAEFSGTIKSSKVESTDIVGSTITGGTITAGDTLYIGSQRDEDGNIIENSYSAWIDINGVLHTNEAHINGTITAIDGMIGGFNIEPTIIEDGVVKAGGRLWSGELQEGQDSVQIGDNKSIFLSATDMSGTMPFYSTVERKDEDGNTIYDENDEVIYDVIQSDLEVEDWRITVGTNFGVTSDGTAYMSNCEIVGGSLRMGAEGDGYHTWISSDGVLNANGVNITGEIHASAGGSIAGWQIDEDKIFKDKMILTTSDDLTYQSFITNTQSPIRINVGEIPGATQRVVYRDLQTQDFETIDGKITFYIKADTTVTYATLSDYACSDEDYVDAMFGAATIEIRDDTIILHIENPDQDENIGFGFAVEYVCEPRFLLLGDGSLYASAANISGTINANNGNIAGINITDNALVGGDIDSPNFELNASKLKFYNTDSSIVFGNNFYLNTENIDGVQTGQIIATGILNIEGINGTKLTFNSRTNATQQSSDITLYVSYRKQSLVNNKRYVQLQLKSTKELLHPLVVECTIQASHTFVGDDLKTYWVSSNYDCTKTLRIEAGATESELSEEIQITDSGNYARFYCTIPLYNITGQNEKIRVGFSTRSDDEDFPDDNDWSSGDSKDFAIGTLTEFLSPNNIIFTGNLIPSEANTYNIGAVGAEINNIRAQTSTILSSDRNLKNTIEPLSEKYSYLFDLLKPVSFKFNMNESNRTHIGLIAQDVEESITQAGLTTVDFAGFCKETTNDGITHYALRYEEFIAICIDEIQKLKKRIVELESNLKTFENK